MQTARSPEPPSRSAAILGRTEFRIGVVAIPVLVFGYYALAFGSLDGFVREIDHCEQLFCDFEKHFHPVGAAIFSERRAVIHFVYPAFAAILFGFFGLFAYPTAEVLWAACQVGFAAALFWLPGPSRRRDGAALTLAYLFVFLTSVPLLHNTKWGQVSVAITAAVLGSFALHARGRSVAAAVLLALAVAIKVYPALFLFYFALRRDLRFLVAFALACVVFLALVPVLVLGPSATWAFHVEVMRVIAELMPGFLERWNTQYAPAVVSRLVWGRYLPESTGGVTLSAVAYALAALNLVALAWVQRRSLEPVADRFAATLFLSIPLLLPVTWPHYMVYLPFCQLVLVRLALAAPAEARSLRATLIALAALSAAGASVFLFREFGAWIPFARSGALMWADLAALVGLWLDTAAALRRARA